MSRRYPHIPTWAIALYSVAGAVLIPWTFTLALELPVRHLARNWDVAWVGFNVFLIFLLFSTAILALKKHLLSALTSSALGTLLVIDAWFDVLTSRPGHEQYRALLLALFVELPMALLAYFLAVRAAHNYEAWHKKA